MDANGPVVLFGCQNCAYRIKSQAEAADLLQSVIRQAHICTIDGGGLLMEARLDPDTVVKMCLWESHCEDCESHEEFGDSVEPEIEAAGP